LSRLNLKAAIRRGSEEEADRAASLVSARGLLPQGHPGPGGGQRGPRQRAAGEENLENRCGHSPGMRVPREAAGEIRGRSRKGRASVERGAGECRFGPATIPGHGLLRRGTAEGDGRGRRNPGPVVGARTDGKPTPGAKTRKKGAVAPTCVGTCRARRRAGRSTNPDRMSFRRGGPATVSIWRGVSAGGARLEAAVGSGIGPGCCRVHGAKSFGFARPAPRHRDRMVEGAPADGKLSSKPSTAFIRLRPASAAASPKPGPAFVWQGLVV